MHPMKKYLQDQGLTLKGFARRVGTSPVYLSHIMAGRSTPSLRFAARLVAAANGNLTYEDFLPVSSPGLTDISMQK